MADLICQMCGKTNPEDQDVCRHCGARLTPLEASPPEDTPRENGEQPSSPSPFEKPAQSVPPEDDDLSWLDELRDEEEAEPTDRITPEPLDDQLEEDEETDWLERIQRLNTEPEEDLSPGDLESEDDFPSWMTTELGESAEPESQPAAEEPSEPDLPDWLQVRTDELGLEPSPAEEREQFFGPGQEKEPERKPEREPERKPEPESKPDSAPEPDLRPEPDQPPPEQLVQEDIPDGEDRPDGWEDSPEEPGGIQTEAAAGDEAEEPAPPHDQEQEGAAREPAEIPEKTSRFPSWASKIQPGEESPQDWDEEDEEIPEDLQFLAGITDEDPPRREEEPEHIPADEPAPQTETTVDPFAMEEEEEEELFDDLFEEDLPSWLTSAVDLDDQPAEETISPGDLPGWVEAMRPVVEQSDPTGLAEDEEYLENYGPLAGISNILPAEPDIETAPEDDKSQSAMSLSVSKTQRDYADLLEKVIAQENKVRPVTEPAALPTQRILRWLITLVLILSLSAVIIFGGGSEQGEAAFQAERYPGATALHEIIGELDQGAPVLVAFDYQPALAGEFHYTASGVIDHLMTRGAYLSFISTQATGPTLAEYFLQTTQEDHDYTHGLQYLNLGYLPGGGAGLLSFSIAPRTIIPLAFDGSNAWDSPPLEKVESINDFALILILTEDPTTAKLWVEQVQTASTPPMGMIVSAQAEPLIQPYFQTTPRQVSGYVAGILGGYAYENLSGEPHLAHAAWLPFNTGILITASAIFIGGLANGILTLYRRQRGTEGGDYS
jgi:hypothetical protein